MKPKRCPCLYPILPHFSFPWKGGFLPWILEALVCLPPADTGSLSNVGHGTAVAGSQNGRVEAEAPDVGCKWVMKSVWEVGTGCRVVSIQICGL